ncbi:MAG: hypothetical protein R3F54_30195 [Alphaproteobacteria bacterium]
MKLDVLFADWATTRAQNRWLFVAVAALSLALLLVTSLLLGRGPGGAVPVPPELPAETEIASDRAGQDYTGAGLGPVHRDPDRQCDARQMAPSIKYRPSTHIGAGDP